MGACNLCNSHQNYHELLEISPLYIKAGPQFNAINFTFTCSTFTALKGDCLVFYADHVKQLKDSPSFANIHRKIKRKLFEYLTLAQAEAEANNVKHTLIPISIPGLNFTYLMLVKMEPWDGGSKLKLETIISQLTVGYLESFRLRKIKDFTLVQFDQLSGVHHSLSFPPISKAIQEFCSEIKNVNIVCNSSESMKYFYKKIRFYKEKDSESQKICEQIKIRKKNSKKGRKQNIMLF